DFVDAQTTTIYYSDGTTAMGTLGVQNRVIVASEAIPEHVKAAVVAAEDRTFYENAGVNVTGMARALWVNLRGGDRQGGSSITQQYAERYYFDETVSTLRGKLQETMLAIKLDRVQDKDEILSNYLNTIYFGRDSYGIETAARSYFGVSAAELTVSQAALLAGVIPSPNNFDPRVSPQDAERRWNYVLDGMVVTGALTQAERDAQVLPETVEYARSDTYAGPQGYLLDMVERELLATSSITSDDLRSVGYRIVTTVDPALQQAAVESVAAMPADHAANLRTALVTLDPQDGAILALYGGPDFLTQPRNAVTQDVAQAGSTFKPFTLTAYLEAGGSLRSRYLGTDGMVVEGFPDGVSNFGGQSFGEIDVVEATAKSVNAVYAQMNVEVGPAATLDVASRGGLPDEALEGQEVPANVLGTASPHPLDMAQAYNTFSAQGMGTEPFIVRSVEYLDGRVAHTGGVSPAQVFAADVMADVTYALTQVVEAPGATARKAQAVGHPVAGKTGTSNENRSAWFVGYTRQLTTAIALYQVGPNGETEVITPFGGYSQITGGSVPLDVWTAYMTRAMSGREVLEFPERADIGEPNTPPVVAVPQVVGLTEAEATAALTAAGFAVDVQRANDPSVPEGRVASASPTGEAEQGSTVTIVVSQGPGTTAVPEVTGLSQAEARSRLEAAGFAVEVTEVYDPDVPEGEVIGSAPGADAQAEPGSTVTLTVSLGPDPDTVEVVPPPDEEPGPPAAP
ncbi:MAG TPA: transglycosylase domain-containing protein, partial [Actinotalea sp.]|nr:transglycosylase domain-containing protein [Actinotalea sp.]